MQNYLISYDLNQTGQNYKDLIDAIQSYPNARRLLRSVWFVQSGKQSIAIRDHLLDYMDKNDELIVAEIAPGNSAWYLKQEVSNYLMNAL